MPKKIKITLIVMGVCFLALSALSLVFADEYEGCPCGMMQGRGGMMMDRDGMMEGMPAGMHQGMEMREKEGLEEKFFEKVHLILMNADQLGLDDSQKQQIVTLKHDLKKSLIMKDAEIKTIDLDIMYTMSGDSIDAQAVDNLINQKYEAKKQRAREVLQACISLRSMLTQEQKDKLGQLQGKYSMKMMMKQGQPMQMQGQPMQNQPAKAQQQKNQPAQHRMMMNQ